MNIYRLEVKQTFTKIIDLNAKSKNDALSKVNNSILSGDLDLINSNDVDLITNVDFEQFSQIDLTNDFVNYLNDNVKRVVEICTIEELAKFAFGDLSNAMSSFKNKKIIL